MGLFTPISGALTAFGLPIPTYRPFASVGEAIRAVDDADTSRNAIGHRLARTFAATVAERHGLMEAGVLTELLAAPADLVAHLWAGSSWDALTAGLFGPLGGTVRPTLH